VLLRAGGQVLVAALAWPVACYPADPGAADARGHWLGPGPAVSAYPWSREPDPAAEDAWGFLKRQCTSYAAWFLNSHGVPFARPTRGPRGEAVFLDGDDWEHAATLAGFPVSHHPVVGSIAQWHAWEASPPPPRSRDVDRHRPYRDQPEVVGGPYGHVAVVTTVLRDDSVLVAGYDGEERQLELLHTRAPRYLYIGVGSTGSLAPT
jgi:surface antigen